MPAHFFVECAQSGCFTSAGEGGILKAMETKNRKTRYALSREQEKLASRFFGRHVSGAKALALFLASLLACLMPMLLGLRLWRAIPPVVTTGLVGADGADDSMPRAVLVFGVPGLFALLNAICHGQLWLHQKTEKLPPTPVRLLGRWTLAVLSVLLGPLWMLRAAGERATAAFYLPCLLALLLLIVGAGFFDCTRERKLAFRLRCVAYKERAWKKTHRLAALSWMAAGLQLLAVLFSLGRLPPWSGALTLLLLLLPVPAACAFARAE